MESEKNYWSGGVGYPKNGVSKKRWNEIGKMQVVHTIGFIGWRYSRGIGGNLQWRVGKLLLLSRYDRATICATCAQSETKHFHQRGIRFKHKGLLRQRRLRRTTRQLVNETLARPDYKTTRQLVVRQPLVVSWSCSLVVLQSAKRQRSIKELFHSQING